jgi:hypothetical protein
MTEKLVVAPRPVLKNRGVVPPQRKVREKFHNGRRRLS